MRAEEEADGAVWDVELDGGEGRGAGGGGEDALFDWDAGGAVREARRGGIAC